MKRWALTATDGRVFYVYAKTKQTAVKRLGKHDVTIELAGVVVDGAMTPTPKHSAVLAADHDLPSRRRT